MSKYTEYLNSKFTNFPSYTFKDEDKKILDMGQKAEWITNRLLVKKFRKSSVKENTKEDIFAKVKKSIKENKPIYLIVCFGGYKHFWNPSYPEADWAELFNLIFMSEYVAPILAVHEPGVILDYESEDVILPIIDNYSEESLNSYVDSFRNLIKEYSKSTPKNFQIKLVRSQEQCDTEKLLANLKERLPAVIKKWKELPEKERKERLHRTPKNILWKGKEDWSSLSEKEKEQKQEESKIANELYFEVDFDFRGDYFTGYNHIPLVLSWGLCSENIDNWLTLGSTYASVVDFWSGRGILEDRGDRIIPRIVSQNQYKQIKENLISENIDLIPLKNFKKIEIYKGNLEF